MGFPVRMTLYAHAKALFDERYAEMMDSLLRQKAVGYTSSRHVRGAESIVFDFHQDISSDEVLAPGAGSYRHLGLAFS